MFHHMEGTLDLCIIFTTMISGKIVGATAKKTLVLEETLRRNLEDTLLSSQILGGIIFMITSTKHVGCLIRK